MQYPNELKYSKDHEWLRIVDGEAYIGITAFAQSELGDIVFVDIEALEEDLDIEEVFGTVEAVKTVSDLFMPVSGKIVAVNERIENEPELINNDPYGEGWIIKIRIKDLDELQLLLDAEDYIKLIE